MIMHEYSYGTPIRVWDIILSHTRMGYPIRVWDVPYAYGTIYAYGAEHIYVAIYLGRYPAVCLNACISLSMVVLISRD